MDKVEESPQIVLMGSIAAHFFTCHVSHRRLASSQEPPSRAGTETLTRPETKSRLARPALYRVVLLNDDYTPMDFVIAVLKTLFEKNEQESVEIMLKVHHEGRAAAGVFTLDIAEMKALQVHAFAQKNRHPLKCTIEKEEGG